MILTHEDSEICDNLGTWETCGAFRRVRVAIADSEVMVSREALKAHNLDEDFPQYGRSVAKAVMARIEMVDGQPAALSSKWIY
jgi:hypothetical protein